MNLPLPSKKSPVGWSLPDRKEEFHKLHQAPVKATERIANFQGKTLDLPIVRIPINLPKYRIANGRTASAQQEYVSKQGLPENYFEVNDVELEEVQQAQHNILKLMIGEEGLQTKFKDPKNKQVNPVLLDENGFVVNGNRRLCCWRVLFEEDASKYAHFSHIDVVVLPHCDPDELDRLEATLQIEKDIKSDYSWDAEANMLLTKMKRLQLSTTELANLYKKRKPEVEALIEQRNLAADYLKSRNKENMWSLVRDNKYAFEKLHKALNQTSAPNDKALLLQLAYLLIDDPKNAGDRLYNLVPQVKEYLPRIKQEAHEVIEVEFDEADQGGEDLFGAPTGTEDTSAARDFALVDKLRKDNSACDVVRDLVLEVIRNEEQLKDDEKRADFVLKSLKAGLSKIQAAASHGLKAESSKDGVSSQISAIRSALDKIQKWAEGN